MQNKTTYTRKVKSSEWAGGYDHQLVTRKAHNRKRTHVQPQPRRFFTTARSVSLGVVFGSLLGCGYLHQFSDVTLNLLYPTAQAQVVVTPVPTLENVEEVALAAEAGQLVATFSATPLTEKELIIAYIKEVFGEASDKALAVAKCESGIRAEALNNKNRNKTVDYGVFQVNSVHIKRYGTGFTTDWKENVEVAHKIYVAHGNSFRPWVCAGAANEKNYLGQ